VALIVGHKQERSQSMNRIKAWILEFVNAIWALWVGFCFGIQTMRVADRLSLLRDVGHGLISAIVGALALMVTALFWIGLTDVTTRAFPRRE
jgi:hypothetical protein